MIKVTVFYGNEEGKSFNMDYYVNTHMPLVQERLTPFGMRYYNVEQGISDTDPTRLPCTSPSATCCSTTLTASTRASRPTAANWSGDVKNFTDIEPKFLISELVA